MGIEGVGGGGPICSTHADEAEAAASTPQAAATQAAPGAKPPAKDEVTEHAPENPFARASEWLEQHHIESEEKGPKHAAEFAQYAAPGQHDVFGKSNEGGKERSIQLWNTGSHAIKEVSRWGDDQLGGSVQAGWAQSSGKLTYENEPGKRTFGIEGGGEIAALHGETHWNTHVGGEREGVDVKTTMTANLLHVAGDVNGSSSFGKEGAELKGKVDARAMLVDVAAAGSATFRVGHHNVGELGLKLSAGLGAGVVADFHGKVKDGTVDWDSQAGAAWGLAGSLGTTGKVNVLELAAAADDGGLAATALAVVSTGEQLEAGLFDAGAAASRGEQAKLAAGGHSFAAAAMGLVAETLTNRAKGEREIGELFQSGSDAIAGGDDHK